MAQQTESFTGQPAGERDVLLALVEYTGAHIAYLDGNLTYVMASPSYAALFGRPVEQVVGHNHADIHPHTVDLLLHVLAVEPPERHRATGIDLANGSDGKVTYWDWTLTPVTDQSGRVQGLAVFLTDVTELTETRRRTTTLAGEAARHAVELDTVFAAAVNGIIVYDNQGRIVRLNEAARRILGYSAEQMERPMVQRLAAATLLRPDGGVVTLTDFASTRALKGETVLSQVLGLTFRPRPPIWLSFSAAPIVAPDGTITGAVLTFSDVRELLHIQEQLTRLLGQEREQTDRLATLTHELETERQRLFVTLRSIGDGVIATDDAARVTLMNRAAEAMTGWPEEQAIGRPLADVFQIYNEETGKPVRDPVSHVIETGTTQGMANHTVLVSRDGSRRSLADSAAPIIAEDGRPTGVVLVFQDVTERRHLDEERAKVSRLESLGVLAGGIAHDFNNLLTGIIGNITLARMDVTDRPDVADVLADADKSAERARALTQQLLTFAKGGLPVRRATALSDLLTDTAVSAIRGRRAALRLEMAEDLRPANIDAGQITQVVRNLIANADEAMPGGGTITVHAANATVAEGDPLPLAPGQYVLISVEDKGTGIAHDIQDRIFDPYFSTKPGGSGIGLSIVYSVVAKHGGCVAVESEPGRGTTFRVYLPAIAADTGAAPGPEAQTRGRHGKLLVMDDEPAVRAVAVRMLSRLGYNVAAAASGQEAAALYAEAMATGERFDAVFLDVDVPGGVGGAEALALLQREDPTVRAIVCSGYSTDPIISQYATYGFAAAIGKPYRTQDLMAALDAALAVSSGHGAATATA